MALEKIGINFSALQGLEAPNFNITNLTAQEIIDSVPNNANTVTDGFYGIIILIFLSIALFWLFSERNQFSKFNFSVTRSLGLSLNIACIMGSILLQIGHMTSYVHFIYLNTAFMIILTWIYLKNPE